MKNPTPITATWQIGPYVVKAIAARDRQGRKRVFSEWSPPPTAGLNYSEAVEFETKTTELARFAQAAIDEHGIELVLIDDYRNEQRSQP